MAWPIPKIPNRHPLKKPGYRLWIAILILILAIGTCSCLIFWKSTTYSEVLIYGALPALLLWLCLFGIVLNRYEQSVADDLSWQAETEKTKKQWQEWSRQQLAVVGNVLFSPEEKGMDLLLGELAEVPAYPKKPRKLSGPYRDIPALLKETDNLLEQQYPGYRNMLHTIYVMQPHKSLQNKTGEYIAQQWDLNPELVETITPVQSHYDNNKADGVILVLCLQLWSGHLSGSSGELVSAQLISSPLFARQNALPVIAGLGRMMDLDPENIAHDLDMLFEYNELDKKTLQHVWLSGPEEMAARKIMQYAEKNHWPLPEKRPLNSIDYSFGPQGELAFPVSLAMLTEAGQKTDRDQLIIFHTQQQTGTLCLITRELYL